MINGQKYVIEVEFSDTNGRAYAIETLTRISHKQ